MLRVYVREIFLEKEYFKQGWKKLMLLYNTLSDAEREQIYHHGNATVGIYLEKSDVIIQYFIR
jgi:hypothetical protein